MKYHGLTDREAALRGPDTDKYDSGFGTGHVWQEFKETFSDPMIRILLIIAGMMVVMFFLGYSEIYEPVGTVTAVLIVAFVTAKTNVASDVKYRELKDSARKDTCKVYRNGLMSVIDVDDVVVGDAVVLQSGDKIPADGILVQGELRVDNSALNGETEECRKTAASASERLPEEVTGDTFVDRHSLFRGAVVFDGEGILSVQRVGLKTMMGKDGGGNAGRRTGFSAEGEIKQAGRTDFSFRIYRRCGDRCPVSVISGGLCGRHCAVSEFRLVRSISGRGGSGISRRGNRRLCCTGGAASDDFSGADAEYQQNAGS